MKKSVQTIVFSCIIILAIVCSIVAVSVYATTHGDNVISEGFSITKSGQECTIVSYNGDDENIKIPAYIAGKKVTKVASRAFASSKVKNIEFSDSIKSITFEDQAFAEMSKLIYIKLPSSLKEISSQAFYNCTSLTHISWGENIEKIGDKAFYNCDDLTYTGDNIENGIVFPQALESIGNNAFENAKAIKKVTFKTNLEKIGNASFLNASSIVNIVAENNRIKSIGNEAFKQTRISSKENAEIKFPLVEEIGEYAFASISSNFQYFSLPLTLKKIGSYAFADCSDLQTIVYDKDIDMEMGEGVFSNCAYLAKISPIGNDSVNKLPDKMTTIPKLTFAGAYRLLYSKDFTIGKDVETIEDGAFAIFYSEKTNRLNYRSYELKVDSMNSNYKMVKLNNFYRDSESNPAKKQHSVLVTIDGSQLIAYIGNYEIKYDEDNYVGAYSKEGDNTTIAFKFLDIEDLRDSLYNIGAYAFAGVGFETMLFPSGITTIGENAFAKSAVTNLLFQNDVAKDGLNEKAFADMSKDAEVFTLLGVSRPNLEEAVAKMNENDIDILGVGSMNMPK